jgi:hypothetical protein
MPSLCDAGSSPFVFNTPAPVKPNVSLFQSVLSLIYSFCQDFKRAGISRLLKEKGREQFWPKKGNLLLTRRKTGQKFAPFRVNKMFFHEF